MTPPPASPKIFHITHVENLKDIINSGGLVADRRISAVRGPKAEIGMTTIKARRRGLPVPCHPGTHVGDFVPFYFCPRSIMLYVLHCANHPDLTYRDGQAQIVHLEGDLQTVVAWAVRSGRRWAFSLSNAGAAYAEFRDNLANLNEIDWNAVHARDFRASAVKEAKQAEFLIEGEFPWALVTRIGVASHPVAEEVRTALQGAAHQPSVTVQPTWYF